jgi:hypothetical protein
MEKDQDDQGPTPQRIQKAGGDQTIFGVHDDPALAEQTSRVDPRQVDPVRPRLALTI